MSRSSRRLSETQVGTHPPGATGVAVTLAASLLALASPGAERGSGCAALVVTKANVAYRHEAASRRP
jgi:hypothetical protein